MPRYALVGAVAVSVLLASAAFGVEGLVRRTPKPIKSPTATSHRGPGRPPVQRMDGDWSKSGGNARRNALSPWVGPTFFDPLWSVQDFAVISWQPLVAKRTAFVVRHKGFPASATDSYISALSLDTGETLWQGSIPFEPGDAFTSLMGARDNRVYATRAGNGAFAPLYALDARTGGIVWASAEDIQVGPYSWVLFAQNGDPIQAGTPFVKRFDKATGATLWTHPRSCPDTVPCGMAMSGDAIYLLDYSDTLQTHLVRLDAVTGAEMYAGPTLPFPFMAKNDPMVGLDGTVYLSHGGTLHALFDDGAGFAEKWAVPIAEQYTAEMGVGPDGSIYTLGSGLEVVRLDPATGATLGASAPIPAESFYVFAAPRFAVDAAGTVFMQTGGTSDAARLYAFTNGLAPLWDTPVRWPNIGGPALGEDGTLVMGDLDGVRAFRADTCSDGRCRLAQTETGSCFDRFSCGGDTLVGGGARSWVAFDPRKLRGVDPCGADLVFRQTNGENAPFGWPITLEVHDVSTQIEDLVALHVPPDPLGEQIHDDLGTGSLYAAFTMQAENDGAVVRVPLGALGLSALRAAAEAGASRFAVGLSTPDSGGFLGPKEAAIDVVSCDAKNINLYPAP